MPRVLHPPPDTSPPDDVAAGLVDAVRAYTTGANGRNLTAQQRAVGAHHLAVAAARAFNAALAHARDAGTSWPELSRTHGMAISSLQRRVGRATPDPGGSQ